MNTVSPNTTERTAHLTAFPINPAPDSLFLRAIQESKQIHNLTQQQPNTQSSIVQQSWDAIPPPPLPVIQQKPNDMSTSIQQSWETNPAQQQSFDQFISRQQTWETSPQQPFRDSLFAQAIENMSRAPPSSLIPPQLEQQSSISIPLSALSQPFQSLQQAPLSILQRAIQQSDQQFNTNQISSPISNGFNNVTPFQPFDLIPPNTYPGFPVGPLPNQVPLPQQQQQSPVQPNNIRMGLPQTMTSPANASHSSPPSQTQATQQMNSPRMSGGSTLQFVPSQVLRKMSKSHK